MMCNGKACDAIRFVMQFIDMNTWAIRSHFACVFEEAFQLNTLALHSNSDDDSNTNNNNHKMCALLAEHPVWFGTKSHIKNWTKLKRRPIAETKMRESVRSIVCNGMRFIDFFSAVSIWTSNVSWWLATIGIFIYFLLLFEFMTMDSALVAACEFRYLKATALFVWVGHTAFGGPSVSVKWFQ